MQDQQADISWRGGAVPVSTRFDDPYYSLENGLAETGHVFLAGNDLPDRYRDGFHIAELGFGTGLNALVAAQAWTQHRIPGHLTITSFEAFPMEPQEIAQALAAFPEIDSRALCALCAAYPARTISLGLGITLHLILGDARETVPDWDGAADAWFLDGFSPAKNPELWEAPLMQAVFDHTRPGGTFATYTAAGAVRRALAEAGFAVERVAGYGRKRHMSRGRRA